MRLPGRDRRLDLSWIVNKVVTFLPYRFAECTWRTDFVALGSINEERLGMAVSGTRGTPPSVRVVCGGMVAGILVLSGCGGGGDIIINAENNSSTTTVNQDGGGNEDSNPCASYSDPDTDDEIQGSWDGTDCTYSSDFVGENNPLTVDVTFPEIDGVHIFEDSLVVGENAEHTQNEGPIVTIEEGNTLAWEGTDYLLVHRGARIIASGRENAPITFTAISDAVDDSAPPFETNLWGGVVINGKGITNKCSDEQREQDTCNIAGEGEPSNYGGNNNADDSGELRYVIIKHPGYEVAPGDELNGLTLNAVGSGTTIDHIQVYSTFDDGVEFFGGAVEITNFIALYVKDDSIDYADGWVGSITNALVIHHEENGNRCIEADGQGDDFSAVPTTDPQIYNMTCIISGELGTPDGLGTHGDSEGIILRRGVASAIANSIIFDAHAQNELDRPGNECFEIDDTESRAHAEDGTMKMKSTLIACAEATKDSLNNGDSVRDWVLNSNGSYSENTNNKIVDDTASQNVSILDRFYTLSEFVDADGNVFTITTTDGKPLGAVTRDDDWTEEWSICLEPRAESRNGCGLWF